MLFLFILLHINLFSQQNGNTGSPFFTNYAPKMYRAHVQNWDIVQDKNGIMYFANGDGLLEFDGVNWRIIALPDNATVRSLAVDYFGRIYVGGFAEFGFLDKDSQGGTVYKSLSKNLPENKKAFKDILGLVIYNDDVYFRSNHKVFKYSNDEIITFNTKGKITSEFIYRNKLFYTNQKSGLQILTDDGFKTVTDNKEFKTPDLKYLYTYADKQAVFFSKENGLFYYPDKNNSRYNVNHISNLIDINVVTLQNGIVNPGEKIVLGTNNKGCFIFDLSFHDVFHVYSGYGLINDNVNCVFEDRSKNIWLALNTGIASIEESPITYFNASNGLKGVVLALQQHNDNIYIGTAQGLFWLQNDSPDNSLSIVDGFTKKCWSFVNFTFRNRESVFMLGAEDGIYEIKKQKIYQLFSTPTVFVFHCSKKYPQKIFAGLNNGLMLLKYENNKIIIEKQFDEIKDNIRSIMEMPDGTLWLGTFRSGAIRLNFDDKGEKIIKLTKYKTDKGFPGLKNVQVYNYNNSPLFCSNDGIFKYNEKSDSIIYEPAFGKKYTTGEHDVFLFKQLANNKIILSGLNNKRSNIYIGKKNSDNDFLWDGRAFRRLPEMLVLSIINTDDKIIWIGGTEGLFRFDKEKDKQQPVKEKALIRKVIINNDSIVFMGTKKQQIQKEYNTETPNVIEIKYKYNSLAFHYTLPCYRMLEANTFSYRLEGFRDEWSPWNSETYTQYTNLFEGEYAFIVKGKNVYGDESEIAKFSFEILPPWYRTPYAYIAYVFMVVAFFSIGVKINQRRLIAANQRLEIIIQERTAEIEEQNEEIMIQNQEILNQKEEIEAQSHQLERANHELEKLSIVARETDNAVIIMDESGNFEWVNEGFEHVHGITLKQLIEKKGSNILFSSTNPDIQNIIKKCKEARKARYYESFTYSAAGQRRWLQTTLTPILDEYDKISKLIAIDTDITKLKESEERIEKQNAELRQLNATKDKFFSIIAHDLKNPFHSLIGFSEMLITFGEKLTKEKKQKYINSIHEASKNGYDLLQNLLEWSRSQTGTLRIEPAKFKIRKVLDEIIPLLEQMAERKKIMIIVKREREIEFFADKNMTSTIIRNLISNAIKFSHQNSEIIVEMDILNDDFAQIKVQDSGVGIDKEDIKKLFRIDQSHTTEGTDNEKGTGLGLILCKDFAKNNNGDISVESTMGKGSSFYLKLPRRQL